MRLLEYLKKELIILDLDAKDRDIAIEKTVDVISRSGALRDRDAFYQQVKEREDLHTTAVGAGVAFPHARTDTIRQIVIAFARLLPGVDFKAEDGEPVKLMFLLGTPTESVSEYLKVLAALSKKISQQKVRDVLLSANEPEQILEVFEE